MRGKKYINPYNLWIGAFIPNWLLRRKDVSYGAKICYARLCQYSGKGGNCHPRQEVLGLEIGVSARQVRYYIEELERHKLIETKQLGMRKANRYYFLHHSWMMEKPSEEPIPDQQDTSTHPPSERQVVSTQDLSNLSAPYILRESKENIPPSKKKDPKAPFISEIVTHYIQVCGIDKSTLITRDWMSLSKQARRLLDRTGDVELIKRGCAWLSNQKPQFRTLHMLDKQWQAFLAIKKKEDGSGGQFFYEAPESDSKGNVEGEGGTA